MAGYQELLGRIQALMAETQPVVLAIDGPCGSGKTTLAGRLMEDFPGSVTVHADDFFLQPHQRSPQRLQEPGGNMDRDRLNTQVLSRLRGGRPFQYQAYDCQENRLNPVLFAPGPLVIIEGSYCLHPDLTGAYDLKVFLTIDPDTQLQRLKARVPEAMLPRFQGEWIPMENRYFEHFKIKENSDLVLSL